MDAKIKQKEKVINFEIEKEKFRLGNCDKYIEFDTGDIFIPERFSTAKKEITEYIEDLRKKYNIKDIDDISNIDTGNVQEDIKAIREADEFVKSKIDYIFNEEVSKNAFGNASCLTATKKGEYYFENFLNAVIPIIEEEFDVRLNKVSVRAKHYLDNKGKYSK